MPVVNCKWCGKPKKVRSADIKRGWGKFCSKKCKAMEQEKRTHQNKNYHTGKGHIDSDREHEDCMNSVEAGWDGHKNVI